MTFTVKVESWEKKEKDTEAQPASSDKDEL